MLENLYGLSLNMLQSLGIQPPLVPHVYVSGVCINFQMQIFNIYFCYLINNAEYEIWTFKYNLSASLL